MRLGGEWGAEGLGFIAWGVRRASEGDRGDRGIPDPSGSGRSPARSWRGRGVREDGAGPTGQREGERGEGVGWPMPTGFGERARGKGELGWLGWRWAGQLGRLGWAWRGAEEGAARAGPGVAWLAPLGVFFYFLFLLNGER